MRHINILASSKFSNEDYLNLEFNESLIQENIDKIITLYFSNWKMAYEAENKITTN